MTPFTPATKIEERLVQSATEKQIPLGGSFELLPLCNMNCRMCFLRLNPEEMKAQGRLRTAEEWLELAVQAKNAGMLFLLLTGGEPFLYPEITELYPQLAKLGLYITINTNGTLITEAHADMLQRHLPRRVNITLYGSSDELYGRLCGNPHGFTQTMRAIRLLKDRNIPLKLNGSLTVDNREDLKNIQWIAHELDIPLEVDTYMYPSSRKGTCPFDQSSRLTPEEAAAGYVEVKREELKEDEFWELAKAMSQCYYDGKDFEGSCALEPMPCRAGLSAFWVNWKGFMTPCIFMEEPGIPVFEEGFEKSWEYIRQERRKIFMPQACTKCGKRAVCQVCAACACTETGSFAGKPEYMCRLTEEKLRRMNALYEERQEKRL